MEVVALGESEMQKKEKGESASVSQGLKGRTLSRHKSELLLLVFGELGQDDEEAHKDGDEVKEELERVTHEVTLACESLLDDQLSVEHDVEAEDDQAEVELDVEQEVRSEEDVEEAREEKNREARAQEATKIEHRSSLSKDGAQGETDEDGAGTQESSGDDSRIDGDNCGKERSHTDSLQEAQTK